MLEQIKTWFADLQENWLLDAHNIFRSGFDATGGLIVLVAIPLVSVATLLYQLFNEQGITFTSYTYPLIALCLSAAYDVFGRWGKKSFRNVKLGIRLALDMAALVMTLILWFAETIGILHFIPALLLLLSGVMLMKDMHTRWRISIEFYRIRRSSDVPVQEKKQNVAG